MHDIVSVSEFAWNGVDIADSVGNLSRITWTKYR